jgi:hypothetical protein
MQKEESAMQLLLWKGVSIRCAGPKPINETRQVKDCSRCILFERFRKLHVFLFNALRSPHDSRKASGGRPGIFLNASAHIQTQAADFEEEDQHPEASTSSVPTSFTGRVCCGLLPTVLRRDYVDSQIHWHAWIGYLGQAANLNTGNVDPIYTVPYRLERDAR